MENRNRLYKSLKLANKSFPHKHSLIYFSDLFYFHITCIASKHIFHSPLVFPYFHKYFQKYFHILLPLCPSHLICPSVILARKPPIDVSSTSYTIHNLWVDEFALMIHSSLLYTLPWFYEPFVHRETLNSFSSSPGTLLQGISVIGRDHLKNPYYSNQNDILPISDMHY